MKVKNIFTLAVLCVPLIVGAQGFRTINGEDNNEQNPSWGASNGEIVNRFEPAFTNGFSSPARIDQMNPRTVSNILFDQEKEINNISQLSDFVWVFGQFLEHDLVFVPVHSGDINSSESNSIVIPDNDGDMTPGKMIPLMRSKHIGGTGTEIGNPRRYSNNITAFIDASNVYGSDISRADWLRTFSGGKLKTSKGGMLPWNTISGEFNDRVDTGAPEMSDDLGTNNKLFVAGDMRANENPLLLTLHTIFVREHNRLCESWLSEDRGLNADDPMTDEVLYQRARKLVGAMLQKVVYEDWLPEIGINLESYSGYNESVNPSISNTFSAAAFKWGHTMTCNDIARVSLDGSEHGHGNILMQNAFFNPIDVLRTEVDPYLKGMGSQMQQSLDCKVVDGVRNYVFENNPTIGGLDFVAMNIQRGRDRGLKSYVEIRDELGLSPTTSFEDICADEEIAEGLEFLYGSIENIDPLVGMLAEDHEAGMIFGSVIAKIMEEQFASLRDGDRFFYLNDNELSDEEKRLVSESTLGLIITRNSDIECLQENVFTAVDHNSIPCYPEILPVHLDIAIGPNPMINYAKLSLYSIEDGPSTVWIIDHMGRQVYSKIVDLVPGENHIDIELGGHIPSGYYHLYIDIDEKVAVKKLLKI